MDGHRMLAFIDQRLQEVNNSNQPFGGTSIVAFGDLCQLQPVMDVFILADFEVSKASCGGSHEQPANSG